MYTLPNICVHCVCLAYTIWYVCLFGHVSVCTHRAYSRIFVKLFILFYLLTIIFGCEKVLETGGRTRMKRTALDVYRDKIAALEAEVRRLNGLLDKAVATIRSLLEMRKEH